MTILDPRHYFGLHFPDLSLVVLWSCHYPAQHPHLLLHPPGNLVCPSVDELLLQASVARAEHRTDDIGFEDEIGESNAEMDPDDKREERLFS